MIVNSTDEALITKHPSPKFQKLSIKKKETVYKYTWWEGMQYCAICTKNTDLESYTN